MAEAATSGKGNDDAVALDGLGSHSRASQKGLHNSFRTLDRVSQRDDDDRVSRCLLAEPS